MTTGTAKRRLLGGVVALALTSCGSSASPAAPSSALGDDEITIGSFDFQESQVLARVYAEVLEMHGYSVELQLGAGPRELLLPALAAGLVEMVPEYAGTALQFISTGEVVPEADPATTHAALATALAEDGRIRALAPAPAQDANAIVVTQSTADEYGLRTISDLVPVADQLTFGGPPECPTRPFCMMGLESRYGLHFKEFIETDAGGPKTRDALQHGHVDVGLLFTTDATITPGGFVELVDDLALQPAENVTPLVHATVAGRFGPEVGTLIDDVSGRLSTGELRELNRRITRGASIDQVADYWLRTEGLR